MDNVINNYMGYDFPRGLNLASMHMLLGNNASSVLGLGIVNATSTVGGMVLGGNRMEGRRPLKYKIDGG